MADAGSLTDGRGATCPTRGPVPAGTPLGTVRGRSDDSPRHDGVLADWLVQDGDLVAAGHPIVRLYPEVSE